MKIIGMLLIVGSAVFFSYERSKNAQRELFILEELFRFIERIRTDIGYYLRPIAEIAADFSSDVLLKLGFLSDVQNKGARAAYINLAAKTAFSEEEKRILEKFFSTLGNGYAEDEIKLIDLTLSMLSDTLRARRESLPKQKKLSLTLSCAGALALIILLI